MLYLDNIRNILVTLLVLALFGGGMFFLGMRNVETITPPPVIIEMPAIQKKTEVITLSPTHREIVLGPPHKVRVDSIYYHKYIKELSEKKRLQLFIDAIEIEEKTITVVDDSILRIDVTSKTRGELLSQFAEYTVKPRSMTVQPEPYFVPKLKVFVGGIFSMPVDLIDARPTLEANIMFERTGKEDMFILGIDSDRYVSVGYMFRIFKGKKK